MNLVNIGLLKEKYYKNYNKGSNKNLEIFEFCKLFKD